MRNINTYFIVSDIHGFYDPLKQALSDAKYDKDNKNHILIVLGDIFDRGGQAKEVFEFLNSIPEDNLILIKGNHEYMLLELLNKLKPSWYDHANGTVDTICQFVPENKNDSWVDVCNKFKKLPVYKFLATREWKPYYELDKYIFVHCFIPLLGNPESVANYNPDWRNDTNKDHLYLATWFCPWQLYKHGLFDYEIEKGKVLACGHWHVNDFHKEFEHDPNWENNFDIYYGKNLVAIDACTTISGKINVLIIKNNKIIF
ncbi:MAG: metallophosphoesterase [Mycoplasma sp.]|nr:metallophosphoesterase [Candidatus Hennigella equi]